MPLLPTSLNGFPVTIPCSVKCSYLELYNEEITDLLAVGADVPKVRPPAGMRPAWKAMHAQRCRGCRLWAPCAVCGLPVLRVGLLCGLPVVHAAHGGLCLPLVALQVGEDCGSLPTDLPTALPC